LFANSSRLGQKSFSFGAPVGRGGSMTLSDKFEKIQSHFQTLSNIASSLNAASDELTSSVKILSDSLKKLNVGLTVWVVFRTRIDDVPHLYDHDEIGYCKVGGEWGIALRSVNGNLARDEHNTESLYLFNDAPREMRLAAVDRLPALIEALAKEAFNTTKRVQQKAQQVRELAQAISNASVAEQPTPTQNVKPISGLRELLEKTTWTPHDQAKAEAKIRALTNSNVLITKKDGGK
jgi:cell division septum initiation protein DivIVA